jgi:hypothetical protein
MFGAVIYWGNYNVCLKIRQALSQMILRSTEKIHENPSCLVERSIARPLQQHQLLSVLGSLLHGMTINTSAS